MLFKKKQLIFGLFFYELFNYSSMQDNTWDQNLIDF